MSNIEITLSFRYYERISHLGKVTNTHDYTTNEISLFTTYEYCIVSFGTPRET